MRKGAQVPTAAGTIASELRAGCRGRKEQEIQGWRALHAGARMVVTALLRPSCRCITGRQWRASVLAEMDGAAEPPANASWQSETAPVPL
jgi:hypothetical protein